MPKLSEEEHALLVHGRTTPLEDGGWTLDLPQMGPENYARIKPILLALGFAWKRSQNVHIGSPNARDLLHMALATRHWRDAKKEREFFQTPDAIADLLIAQFEDHLWDVDERYSFLEPSAGDGALVAALLRKYPRAAVTAVEPDPHSNANLHAQFGDRITVFANSFEAAPLHHEFDGVVLNPPFSLIRDHLSLGYQLLRPYGRIAAMGPSTLAPMRSRTKNAERAFDDWLEDHWATCVDLPEKCFAEAGTSISTCIVALDREPTWSKSTIAKLEREGHTVDINAWNRLRALSNDLHKLMEDYCNGAIECPEHEELESGLLRAAASLVRMAVSNLPDRIEPEVPDPRAGHGLRFNFPAATGIANTWDHNGLAIPKLPAHAHRAIKINAIPAVTQIAQPQDEARAPIAQQRQIDLFAA